MDRVFLRQQFLKHKELLKRIKNSDNISKLLSNLSDDEINLCLKILHLVGDGEIPISSKHKNAVIKSKRSKKLMGMGSRPYFKELMKKDRLAKTKELRLFSSLLPLIVESLFE